MKARAETIDEYLAGVNEDDRAALQTLREIIAGTAPDAVECISYQLPAFRLNGPLVAFGASAKHCAFYPMSPSALEAHADALRMLDTSKGTIRFKPEEPLPPSLIRAIVKTRIAENDAIALERAKKR